LLPDGVCACRKVGQLIDKREILELATKLGLGPQVVEKDYALGWFLAGIYNHDALAEHWVFKGGTCLKKCYFETYRFSEDLDFTLHDDAYLQEDFLKRVFAEISEWIYEQCGLEIPPDMQKFEIYKNPRGALSCQGTVAYRGPVSPKGKNIPRIKLDLTADELLVLAPVHLPVFHPYSDEPDDGIQALSYAYEEAFGEKIRALAERTRPRDLYDVINLFRNTEARPEGAVVRDVLKKKCEFKGIAVPVIDDLMPHRPDLEGAWPHMLGHQLPSLPPVESFWEALPAFFSWLREEAVPAAPAAYKLGSGETIIRARSLHLPISSAGQSSLEVIRFAAANRLCVDLDYQGSTRRIEAYSLRETRDGNIILHAWNRDSNAHRSYRVDRIHGAKVTSETFIPRYEVELVPSGPQTIPPTSLTSNIGRPTARSAGVRSTPSRRRSTSSFGPTYIYECGLCGKKFRRKRQTSALNQHKTPDGYQCSGRTALYVDTQY